MTKRMLSYAQDLVLLGGAVFFFLGCIATAHRGPRTLASGQVSVAGSYMRASLTEDAAGSEPVQLITADARAGVGGGVDMGAAYTRDITSENEGLYSSIWGDLKWQLSNRANRPGVPILTLGLLKGYVYDENVQTHITSLPLMLGVPAGDRVTPFILYRYELLSDAFVPASFEEPRHAVLLGTEFLLGEASKGPIPRIGIGVGWMSSLAGDGDPLLLLNLGVGVDTQRRVP